MAQGQFTAADLDQSAAPAQAGQFTAADIDGNAKPGFFSRLGSGVEKAFDPNNRVNIPNDPAASDALNLVRDTAINTGKDIYNIGPGFLAEQWHKHTGGNVPIPTPSDEAVQRSAKNIGVSALLAAPEAVEAEGALSAGRATAPKPATSAVAPAAEDSAPGALSRAWEVAKRRAGHIPGVQAFKDAKYVVSGDGAPEPPAPAAPGVPDNWGKGVYGTPVDLWGKRVAETPAPEPQPSAPSTITRGSLSKMMGDQLEKGLGASPPLDPKVPIRQQINAKPAGPELLEGHTAVDSSALRSYKYDPAKQEFEAWPTSGETAYRYGEVSPDAAKAFEGAPSKGKAFQQIKNSGTLVAKRVNGQWVPIKPARGSIAEGMKK